jgi:hypothetical protein
MAKNCDIKTRVSLLLSSMFSETMDKFPGFSTPMNTDLTDRFGPREDKTLNLLNAKTDTFFREFVTLLKTEYGKPESELIKFMNNYVNTEFSGDNGKSILRAYLGSDNPSYMKIQTFIEETYEYYSSLRVCTVEEHKAFARLVVEFLSTFIWINSYISMSPLKDVPQFVRVIDMMICRGYFDKDSTVHLTFKVIIDKMNSGGKKRKEAATPSITNVPSSAPSDTDVDTLLGRINC